MSSPKLRRACVVAPLIAKEGEWRILFTLRGDNLSSHGGQVSFPGGVVEQGEGLEEAALREVEEEIGVPASAVQLIGRLDDLVTHSGFLVAPFVGIIPENFDYLIQSQEVDEVFEVPVDTLMRRDNPLVKNVEFRGRMYPSYFYEHGGPVVWGLTARMVKALLDVVRATT